MAKLEVFQNGNFSSGEPVYQIGSKYKDGEYGEYVSTPTMDSLVWNHRNLFTSIERVYRSGLSIPETEYSL